MPLRFTRCALPLILILLAGCAAPPRLPAPMLQAEWEARRVRLSDLHAWQLSGRIAFRLENEGWSATLHWVQRDGEYVLRLIAPLGRGTWELSGSDAGVLLRTADNRILHAGDPESLLRQNLGWDLPVSGLVYWIRGLPEPGRPTDSLLLDGKGRIDGLRQDGWQVSYHSYESDSGYDLPGKMTLENERLTVRLSISEWKIPS